MSWRILIVVLLTAAGLSAWAGISLGNWLIAHGPETPAIPEALVDSDVPVLNADGQPFVAQPPQPLVNGRLGIPEPGEHIAWELPEQSLAEQSDHPPIAIATTTITLDEARDIAESGGTQFHGLADAGELMGQGTGQAQGVQPIDVPPPPASPDASQAQQGDWQLALRQEIEACSTLGFFERPSCAWAARNKYCGPNNAWGTTRDCPKKSF